MTPLDDADRDMLRASIDRFVMAHYTFARRRERLSIATGCDDAVWQAWATHGWLGIGLPEAAGGFGSLRDLDPMMRAIGRGLMLEPYLATVVLAGGLLSLLGSPRQKQRWLVDLIEGRARLAFAYQEPESRFDPLAWRTGARVHRQGLRLSGRKSAVFGGAAASCFIVAARLDPLNEPCLFLLPADAPGLSVTPRRLFDGTMAADLRMDAVLVEPSAMLGDPGPGVLDAVNEVLDRGAAALCAEAVGAMAHTFDATLAHLKQREQFGRPLSQNQVLQHRMVDLFTLRREAEAMTAHAMRSLDGHDATERALAVSAAKLHVGSTAVKMGQAGIQLHGAIGTTDELDISHFFKRLTAIDQSFGPGHWHAARLDGLLRAVETAEAG